MPERECLVDDEPVRQDHLLGRRQQPNAGNLKRAGAMDTTDPRRTAPLVVKPAVRFYLDDYAKDGE